MDMFLMSCPWKIACTKDPKIKKKNPNDNRNLDLPSIICT